RCDDRPPVIAWTALTQIRERAIGGAKLKAAVQVTGYPPDEDHITSPHPRLGVRHRAAGVTEGAASIPTASGRLTSTARDRRGGSGFESHETTSGLRMGHPDRFPSLSYDAH